MLSRPRSLVTTVLRCRTFTSSIPAPHIIYFDRDSRVRVATNDDISSARTIRLRVGPSEAASVAIGDIQKVNVHVVPGNKLPRGQSAVELLWEGYSQTEGDELYHTVWGNIEGVYKFTLPFDSIVVRLNPELVDRPRELRFASLLGYSLFRVS